MVLADDISTNSQAVELLAARDAAGRAELLKNEKIRGLVLNSGANVTLYCGGICNGKTIKERFKNVFVGLIQRKNKSGGHDGLGALGGLAERTSPETFNSLSETDRKAMVGKKDDVVLQAGVPVLTTDINIIRKNNVLREMKEELNDLNISGISINPDKLQLVPMPKVKDDNYLINIWNGKGEVFAVTPFCHLYKDDESLIDRIVSKSEEKEGGEVFAYKKINLFDALQAYGNKGTADCSLENGRHAEKDYRYPHEYLAAWALASELLEHNPQALEDLSAEIQRKCGHPLSFSRLAKDTGQSVRDVAAIMNIDGQTLSKMEKAAKQEWKIRLNTGKFLDKAKTI